jgi:PAS domain S-box-containing protein
MKERVLLVEDNRALAENVAEILRDEELAVSVCHDADGAEREAEACSFDLAIVDIRLAGAKTGLDLVPKLHRLSPHGEVLLITGNATLDSAIRAIRRGVYAYLTKPFEPDHLITLVKRALAQVALKREKHALTQRLAASEALYRNLVESVESCILGLDLHGSVCFSNRFASERLGLPVSALMGQHFAALCVPSDRGATEQKLGKALTGTPVRDYECNVEAGGKRRRIRWTLTPLATLFGSRADPRAATSPSAAQASDDDQAADRPVLLAAGIDITDRVELERRSAEAEAMAAMGTLTTALAHEIRNPLNAAKLQLELFARRAKKLDDGEARELLGGPAEVVRSEINRLGSLLDEFLDLARPRQIERKPIAIGALFDEVEKLEMPVLKSHKVRMTTRVEPADLTMRGDHDKLKQVLLNLIMNAVEALHETPDAQIELSAQRGERTVSLCVRDNGPGVPAALLGSAFTPFVTSKPSGTGLGLAIVQKIARQHGGVAELVAQTRGALVRIEIPH